MINFTWYPFEDLTLRQLYSLLMLRSQVFVVEQECPYLDIDGKDPLALHLLGMEGNQLVAYLRLFPPLAQGDKVIFGRVLIAEQTRNKGYGNQLLEELVFYCGKAFPGKAIECSAQFHLQKFYAAFGFQAVGEPYDEDDIPHIYMIRP